MKKRKICSSVTSLIMLLSVLLVIAPSVNAVCPTYDVFGRIYIDDEIADSEVEVKLVFGEDNYYTEDVPYGEYHIYIPDEYEGQTGTFYVSFGIYSNLRTDPEMITLNPEDVVATCQFVLDLNVSTIDNEPPSKVEGLEVSDAKDGKLNLNWDAATDNVGIDHYNIYRDAVFLISVTSTSYKDTGLTNGQTYTYEVSAVDFSDNEGEKSDPATGSPTKKSSSGGGGGGGTTPPDDETTDDEDAGEEVIPNLPPVMEIFTGDESGTQDTNYTYQVLATDNESHDVSYIFNWDDGSNDTTEYFPHNTTQEILHMWTSAGVYEISAHAMDNYPEEGNGSVSNYLYLTVLIDVHIIDDPTNNVDGYLTDDDSDGIYDMFHDQETAVDYDDVNGTYMIDTDGDGEYDYIYNPDTGSGEPFQTDEPEPPAGGDEPQDDNTMYYIAAIIIIILLILLFFLATRKKKK